MMKRITITLDEEMYMALLEYSLERSKEKLRNYSMSEAIRDLLSRQLPQEAANGPGRSERWARSSTRGMTRP